MARVRVSTVVDAPPRRVWADVRDIASHVEWMRDARAIRFAGRRRTGVGTSFECDTRVGPLRLTDRMVVTEWRTGRSMGIRHQGIVTGSGRFTLHTARGGRTRFTWEERLSFPWWMGGPFGAMAGAFVLRRIWRKNLAAFAQRFR